MARAFATNLNLLSNQIQNVVIHVVVNAAAIASPKEGQVAYFTESKKFSYYSGSAWVELAAGGAVGEATSGTLGTIKLAQDISGSGVSPTVVHFTLTSASSAGGNKITSLAIPTAATDAANKEYVDGKVNGLSWKQPVVVGTTAALPTYTAAGSGATHALTGAAVGVLTIDGVATKLNQRVLVKNGASEKDNGVYTVTTEGTAGAKFVLTRASDFIEESQIIDATLFVEEGTELSDHVFNLTNNVGGAVVDTNNLVWVEIQNGTAVQGDETYTKRTGAKIGVVPGEAAATAPANGAISTLLYSGVRKAVVAFTGDGSKTSFEPTHNLKTRNLIVQGMENSAGNPTKPIELDWETSGENKILFQFPTAPTAGVTYHATILG